MASSRFWYVISHYIVYNLAQHIAYKISHDIADR